MEATKSGGPRISPSSAQYGQTGVFDHEFHHAALFDLAKSEIRSWQRGISDSGVAMDIEEVVLERVDGAGPQDISLDADEPELRIARHSREEGLGEVALHVA